MTVRDVSEYMYILKSPSDCIIIIPRLQYPVQPQYYPISTVLDNIFINACNIFFLHKKISFFQQSHPLIHPHNVRGPDRVHLDSGPLKLCQDALVNKHKEIIETGNHNLMNLQPRLSSLYMKRKRETIWLKHNIILVNKYTIINCLYTEISTYIQHVH